MTAPEPRRLCHAHLLMFCLLVLGIPWGTSAVAQDVGWMQPRVRIWYLGGVGDWDMSSNAEEAYLIQSITGTTASVKYHSAMTHWTVPQLTQVGDYATTDMGPCWMHPQRLQTIQQGDYWRGDQRITLVERDKTFNDLPYRLLPALALQDLAPQRQVVKITYRIARNYSLPTGSAYFDANTGLLLYHNSWWGGTKMFFILAEINYDFARGIALPEDNGPHTGFRSFVSERSQGVFTGFMFIGGGSITIHSMVESRYGATVRMHVMPSIVPSNFGTAYRSFAFFGDVPIVRQMEYPQSRNYRPEQWTPFGHHLWWWLPPALMAGLTAAVATAPIESANVIGEGASQAIDVFDVPMTKTADQPLTYTATQTPQRFHFTMLRFDNDGYLTEFAARDPATGLHVQPGDFNYWNCWATLQQLGRDATDFEHCVDGRVYFREQMALPALPVPGVSSIFPATGPTQGGVTITITGTNFIAGGTGVTIGGAAATDVSVQGTTTLTCTLPAGTLGKRSVVVSTAAGSASVQDAFEYIGGVLIAAPADPTQPVAASLPVPAGALTVTLNAVTTPGVLTAAPVAGQSPPIAQVAFLPNSVLFLSAPGVTFGSAAVCLPYLAADVASAGVAEESLMLWYQPPGSATWIDVTAAHDAPEHRVCGDLTGFSLVAIAAPSGTLPQRRYLAEGATGRFFDTRIALLNPSSAASANTFLRFQRADSTTRVRFVSVPPLGRRTIDVEQAPEMGTAEFSTVIESDEPVVVDRTMLWDDSHYGSHAETSVASPATTWYLAEGATHSGFNLFYLVQNPHPTETAQVRVRYLLPHGAPIEKVHLVAPHSRYNIWVNEEQIPDGSGQKPLAATDVSAVLESLNNVPVIVERAMYFDRPGQLFAAGHESAGVTATASEWFLAEGATGDFFDLFVLVANPMSTDAQVEATYLLPDGTTVLKSYTVAANSRFNIWVDLEDPLLNDTAVSTTIRSTNGVPVIVERAMWWPGPTLVTWAEAHNTAGSTATGTLWALAEGEVDASRNMETYVLIANTSAFPATARVVVLFEDGTRAERTYAGLPPKSRFNVPVGGFFQEAANKRFGVLVESLGTTPAQLVVERAMYWDAAGQTWAAGTNALATRLR